MAKSKSKSSGISLAGLIFLVFLILKLTKIGEVANWSWWWVTAPLWGSAALALGFLAIILTVGVIANHFNKE